MSPSDTAAIPVGDSPRASSAERDLPDRREAAGVGEFIVTATGAFFDSALLSPTAIYSLVPSEPLEK